MAYVARDGSVTVSGGSGGDYLPKVIISDSSKPNKNATGTAVLDKQGGIASINITAYGDNYIPGDVSVVCEPKVSEINIPATFLVEVGQIVKKCEVWEGTLPSGFSPNNPDTWPRLPATPREIKIEEGAYNKAIYVVNVQAFCDGSPCPAS
jgi:hypothetical protein